MPSQWATSSRQSAGASGNLFYVVDQGPAVKAGSNSNVNNYRSALSSSLTVATMYPLDVVFTGSASFVIGPFAKTEKYNLYFAMCCRVDYLYPPNKRRQRVRLRHHRHPAQRQLLVQHHQPAAHVRLCERASAVHSAGVAARARPESQLHVQPYRHLRPQGGLPVPACC